MDFPLTPVTPSTPWLPESLKQLVWLKCVSKKSDTLTDYSHVSQVLILKVLNLYLFLYIGKRLALQ